MSIETPGEREERSDAVPGATAAVVASEPAEDEARGSGGFRGLLRGDIGQLPVFIGLIVIGLYFQFASNGLFLSPENLYNLSGQVTAVPILGLGVAAVLVLLIGEIDLSLSAVAYFCGAVTGVLSVHHGWPAAQAILAGIVLGILIRFLNGGFFAVFRIPPFIGTLGGFFFFQGVLSHILQPKTHLHIYAVGGSAEALRRAGIKVAWLRIAIFTMASTIAAISGLLIDARAVSAAALVNQYLLLFAIAAAVIGGVSLFGGRGSVWGVVLGAIIMGTLTNGLALLNVGADVVEMASGLALVIAVVIDALARRRGVTGYR